MTSRASGDYDRRSYRPSDYDDYDDRRSYSQPRHGSRRDGYEREKPYDTLYRRSFNDPDRDNYSSRRSGDYDRRSSADYDRDRRSNYDDDKRSSYTSHSRFHHNSYEDDADDYRASQSQGQGQVTRRDNGSDNYSVSRQTDPYHDGYEAGRQQLRSRGGNYNDDKSGYGDNRDEEEEKPQLEGIVGKHTKDIAATAIGAVAGAFLGHEAGHGRPTGLIGGAILGGLSANAIEHAHLKRDEKRAHEQKQYES